MEKSFKYYFWLACFLPSYFMVCAQPLHVTGSICDSQSKQPLPNATVVFNLYGQPEKSISANTSGKGIFRIGLTSGMYKISVSYLGYKDLMLDSIKINTDLEIPAVYLHVNTGIMAEVIVTEKKPYLVVGADKITLNVSQSAIASGGQIYDVIRKVPGMTEQNESLSFRGRSIAVLINGRPTNLNGDDLKNMLQTMQANMVERVEILPNPSAKYNAEGGSIVNIILSKDKSLGTNYMLTGTLGAGQKLNGNMGFDATQRNKKMYAYGGYNFAYNKQYFRSTTDRYLENSMLHSEESDQRRRDNHMYKAGIDYELSKQSTLGLSFNGSINFRNRDVVNESGMRWAGTANQDSVDRVNTSGAATFKRSALNCYYKTALDSTGKELVFNADYMYYNKNWTDQFVNRYYDHGGDQYQAPDYIRDYSPARIDVYSLSVDYTQPTKKGRWEMGFKTFYTKTDNDVVWENSQDWIYWMADAGKTNHFIYKENVSAAYINYVIQHKKWQWQLGIRSEQTNTNGYSATLAKTNQKSYVDFFPSLSVQYTKDQNNQIGLAYRKSISRFGFNYVNPFIIYQNKYFYSQGNPLIEPEIYHNIELNYTYQQVYSFALNLVHGIRTLGEIYLQAPNNITIASYGNFQSSTLVYLSASVNQSLTKFWYLSFSPMVGVVAMDNSALGLRQTYQKAVVASQIQCNNTFRFKKGIQAEMACMFITPFRYGSYTRRAQFNTDIGVSKSALKNKLSLKLSISDLFNTANNDRDINYDNIHSSIKFKAESRFINLTARFKFGNTNIKTRRRDDSKIGELQSRLN